MCHEDIFDQGYYNAIYCRYECCETGMKGEIVKNVLIIPDHIIRRIMFFSQFIDF